MRKIQIGSKIEMMIKLYNTLSGKKELLKPLQKNKIKIFVCGPTVYDFPHLGHARTYIVFDALVKYFRQKGYKVFYLQNITDIDDKIIARANEEKVSWKKISKKFEREFLKDMKALSINSVTKYARATDHIKEIISQVSRLIKKGYAYKIKEGIYYDISKFKNYGKLAKRTYIEAEDAISRIDEAIGKKNKGDFCLWKFSKENEPFWESPFGRGRPGWHIEDTAIAEKYLGVQYDLHGGARDLIFPHHEAEIAQMEALSGKSPMVKCWLHTGFLMVNGQKMSKSLKNFITIREFLRKKSARLLRYLMLKVHYRSSFNFTPQFLSQGEKELEKIDNFLEELERLIKKKTNLKPEKNELEFLAKIKKEIQKALSDDFNTPKAIALIFNLIRNLNEKIGKEKISPSLVKEVMDFLKEIDKIFGCLLQKEKKKVPKKILQLVKKREKARKEKNWKVADEIREKIKKLGYLIEDTKNGPRIKKIKT